MKRTFAGDYHYGPPGHPATDCSPGFEAEVARREARGETLHFLGDMTELLQFTREETGRVVRTDVDGNHDRGTAPRVLYIYGPRGLTIGLHGDVLAPLWAKILGRPAARACKLLELVWPDADVRLTAWARRKSGLGRYGDPEIYAQRAAEYAAKYGAWQIVFGHLHERFERWITVDHDGLLTAVHVVCTGCCCNGRLDFVEVEV